VSWLCLRREPSPIVRAWQDSSLARAPPPRGPRFEHDNPCGLYTCGSRASLVPRGFRYCGPDRWLFAVVVGVYHLCTAAPLPPSTPPPHQPPPPLPACLGLSCMLLWGHVSFFPYPCAPLLTGTPRLPHTAPSALQVTWTLSDLLLPLWLLVVCAHVFCRSICALQ